MKLSAMAAGVAFMAMSDGLAVDDRGRPITDVHRPRVQTPDEREAAIQKADGKRERKAVKRLNERRA